MDVTGEEERHGRGGAPRLLPGIPERFRDRVAVVDGPDRVMEHEPGIRFRVVQEAELRREDSRLRLARFLGRR